MKKILYLLILFGLLSIVWVEASWKYGQCIYDNTTSSYVKTEEYITKSGSYTTSGYLFDTSRPERLVCKGLEDAYYKINYNSNYGANETKQSEDLPYGVSSPLPNNVFSRNGYTLDYWCDNHDCSGRYYSSTITGNCGSQGCEINLHAHWKPNSYTYTVKYVSSSGKDLGTAYKEATFGSKQTITPPAKTGYNTPSAQAVTWDSTTAKTITFTYTPITYSISYNLNGGSISGQPTSYTIESNKINIPNPSRRGYSFTGWTGGNSIPAGSTGNKTFTANWAVTDYYYDVSITVTSGLSRDFDNSWKDLPIRVRIWNNNTVQVISGSTSFNSGSGWKEKDNLTVYHGLSGSLNGVYDINGNKISGSFTSKRLNVKIYTNFSLSTVTTNTSITVSSSGVSGGFGQTVWSCGYFASTLTNHIQVSLSAS